ncbi:MAG: CHAT domain-containing protein, partial [Acidobacteriota bacterium]
ESIPGEGLLSLSTALEEAGASAVIASLWDVEDLPTQALVEQFYFQLGQGSTAAQALRDAKLALLNAGGQMAQPSRWAGWVIIGRGEIQLKPRSSHLLRYAAGAAVLALLLLAAWLFIRQFGLRARA